MDKEILSTVFGILSTVFAVVGVASMGYKAYRDARAAREARTRVLEAEKEAFKSIPESFVQKTEELRQSQASLEQQALEISGLIERSQNALLRSLRKAN